jgi:beta-glucosidase
MSAYNKLNGVYCAEDAALLNDVLKKRWGFKGFVVSDWGSTYSTAATVNAGMDLEMPGGEPMKAWLVRPRTLAAGNGGGWLVADKVLPEISTGNSPTTIDENVGRMLRVLSLVDNLMPHAASGEIDTPEQRALARKAAAENIVLLKNEGIYSLDPSKIHSVIVIGPNAAVARAGEAAVRWSPQNVDHSVAGYSESSRSTTASCYSLGVGMEGENPGQDTQKRNCS